MEIRTQFSRVFGCAIGFMRNGAMVFLKASYGKLLALKSTDCIGCCSSTREGCNTRNTVLGGRSSNCFFIEAGLAAQRRIDNKIYLAALDKVDNIGPSFSNLEDVI